MKRFGQLILILFFVSLGLCFVHADSSMIIDPGVDRYSRQEIGKIPNHWRVVVDETGNASFPGNIRVAGEIVASMGMVSGDIGSHAAKVIDVHGVTGSPIASMGSIIKDHNLLFKLSYNESGHTGFARIPRRQRFEITIATTTIAPSWGIENENAFEIYFNGVFNDGYDSISSTSAIFADLIPIGTKVSLVRFD